MVERVIVSLSIVSHDQGSLITRLLDDIGHSNWHGDTPFEVIVTLNIPEDEHWLQGPFTFPVTVIRNERSKGFGANHNAAFRSARGALFAVVNPDIRLAGFRIHDLIIALNREKAGVCGPLVKAPDGADEDSARRFPTIARLIRRKLRARHAPDYRPLGTPVEVDWLAGMFLLFPSSIYREIGGFDERYFMYLEDVEICRHLGRRGRAALWVTSTAVIHDASRASRRNIRHLRWHFGSLAHYLFARKRR